MSCTNHIFPSLWSRSSSSVFFLLGRFRRVNALSLLLPSQDSFVVSFSVLGAIAALSSCSKAFRLKSSTLCPFPLFTTWTTATLCGQCSGKFSRSETPSFAPASFALVYPRRDVFTSLLKYGIRISSFARANQRLFCLMIMGIPIKPW